MLRTTHENEDFERPEVMEAILIHYGWDNSIVLDQRWRTILCPFHGEHKPSARATVYSFHCNSCPVSGDCIKVVMDVERCDFRGALDFIEALTGTSHVRVSKPTQRKSWGIPPFGSGLE